MSEKIKISDGELAEIKLLQTKFQETRNKLGNLQIEKMELDRQVSEFLTQEKTLKEEWISLQKMEQDVLDKIIKVYGTGNLNMTDGTFTPTKE